MKLSRLAPKPFVLVLVLCFLSPTSSAEPQKQLTAEQRQKLKDRNALWQQAKKLRDEGNLPEAITAAEKMLAIEREVFGGIHKYVADSLGVLAEMHEAQENIPAARKARQEALAVLKHLYAADDWRMTDARLSLVDIDRFQTLNRDQRRQLREAEHLTGKVVQFNREGKSREAIAIARQTLAVRKKVLGDMHPDTATSLNNLGFLLYRQGDYSGAGAYYEEALVISKRILGDNHPLTATSLNNLGLLLFSQGSYAAARRYYEQSLDIRKKILGDNHPDTAATLNNLGTLLSDQGDYAGARAYYERALSAFNKIPGDNHPLRATSLNSLGLLLSSQGDYAAARRNYEQALAIRKKVLGDTHPDTANSLNNLGGLLHSQGDYAGARRYFEQALAVYKKVLGDNDPLTATSLNNLGLVLSSQGDFAAARPYYEQGLTIRKKVLGDNHPDTATSLNNLGLVLSSQGDFAAARPYYERALANYKKILGDNHPLTATSLNNLGILLYSEGDYVGAQTYYEQALGISRRNLDLAAAAQSEREQLRMSATLTWPLDSLLSLPQQSAQKGQAAYAHILAWKGTVFARQQAQRRLRGNSALAPLADELRDVTRRLATLQFAVPDPKKRDAWQTQLAKLSDRKEELERELTRKSPVFRKNEQVRNLTPTQLARQLPQGTALIDFLEYNHFRPDPDKRGRLLFEKRLTAFVVKQGSIMRHELGPVGPIAKAVNEWRALVKGQPAAAQKQRETATRLKRLIWDPLVKDLAEAGTVLVSPDGVLSFFPLAALPGTGADSYLIEERAVAVLPVPQLLPELLAPAEKPLVEPSLLLVGQVDFDDAASSAQPVVASLSGAAPPPRGGAFEALPGTRLEVLAIRDSFDERFPDGRSRLLSEDNATKAAIRAQAPKHRYLHLATHGFFAPETVKSALADDGKRRDRSGTGMEMAEVTGWDPGLLSGIVLAGANRPATPEREGGILTALEVAEMDLGACDLAVLSACETGLGRPAGGEGVLGLQRAFQVAGTRTVVASLWSVRDKETRDLMTWFYEGLWGKNGRKLARADALRQAQLRMMREGPRSGGPSRGLEREDNKVVTLKTAPPFYWAAFVLSGDWR